MSVSLVTSLVFPLKFQYNFRTEFDIRQEPVVHRASAPPGRARHEQFPDLSIYFFNFGQGQENILPLPVRIKRGNLPPPENYADYRE